MQSTITDLIHYCAVTDVDGTFDDVMLVYKDRSPKQKYIIAVAASVTLESIISDEITPKISWQEIFSAGAERACVKVTTPVGDSESNAAMFYAGLRLVRPKHQLPHPEGFLFELLRGDVGFSEK